MGTSRISGLNISIPVAPGPVQDVYRVVMVAPNTSFGRMLPLSARP